MTIAQVSQKYGVSADTLRYYERIGLRTVEVDAKQGFLLNGVPLKLKGGCIHHDLGLCPSRFRGQ